MKARQRDHCHPGDVLVDDTLRHRHLWEEAGGIFVHHRNVTETLEELARHFPLAQAAAGEPDRARA